MPDDSPLAPIAVDLFASLRVLKHHFPDLPPAALADAVEALLTFGGKHKLLGPGQPTLTRKTTTAAGALLLHALESAHPDTTRTRQLPGADRRPGELRYHHPMIHVASDVSYYSFAAPYERTYNNRTVTAAGLTTIDSNGRVFPTLQIDRHLRQRVPAIERAAAACSPHLLSDPPPPLLTPQGQQEALDRLRSDFPPELPFRNRLHQRRLRVWCLMTYLHPLMPSTPFLRVRVPDIRSARSVQHLLEACCFNALAVSRRGMKSAIRRHRAALAGTVIFSPELRTGRLPSTALDLLEEPPRSARYEPPVAFVEVWDDSAPPRVPEAWIVDVELAGQVGPVALPPDHRHLGCAVALAQGGALLREAPAHEGTAGVARWLQRVLYGDLLSDKQLASAANAAERAEAFVMRENELAGLASQVWAACLQETLDGDDDGGDSDGDVANTAALAASTVKQQARCNPACLRQRMLSSFPRARSLLKAEGWDHHFTGRLLEQGVVTYTVKHMRGCLSLAKSAEWQGRNTRGVEVPISRLPAGVVL